MTGKELDALLRRHRLKRVDAARIVRRDVRTVRRWIEGTRHMSDADAGLLSMLDEGVSLKRVLRAVERGASDE